MEIKKGQIWQVVTERFLAQPNQLGQSDKTLRPVNLIKEEYIEIRYPFEWHFRTEDNQYFNATAAHIQDNCKFVGVIWSNVQQSSDATLADILRLKLYDKRNNQ